MTPHPSLETLEAENFNARRSVGPANRQPHRLQFVIVIFSMYYKTCLFSVLVATVSALDPQARALDDEVEHAVRQYLSVKYDEAEELGPERRIIYGVAYNPAARLMPLDIPELAMVLPNTQYFTTILDTPSMCYRELEVIVAATRSDSGFVIRSAVSPVYIQEPSRKFMSVVRRKVASTDADRRQLAMGIGKTLAAITSNGQLKNPKTADQMASVELWHGDLHLGNIELRFDDENQVETVFFDCMSANTEDKIAKKPLTSRVSTGGAE